MFSYGVLVLFPLQLPDSGRPRRPGPAPIRASEGLRAPVAMVVSPRPERAGQADQDGRPSGAALPAIELSVIRGVGSSMVVPGSVGSHRPVIAGAKLREEKTTILPRGRALQGVGLSSMRFHPIGGGPEDDKDGQEGCSTTANASLYGHSSHRWRVRIELLARFLPLLERTVLRRQGEPFSDIS